MCLDIDGQLYREMCHRQDFFRMVVCEIRCLGRIDFEVNQDRAIGGAHHFLYLAQVEFPFSNSDGLQLRSTVPVQEVRARVLRAILQDECVPHVETVDRGARFGNRLQVDTTGVRECGQ